MTTRGKNTSQKSDGATKPPARPDAAPGNAAGLDDARHRQSQVFSQQVDLLRNGRMAICMAQALNLPHEGGAIGAKIYMEELLREAGSPSDPVEVMMIQQLALAHFRIADLHSRAGGAEHLDAVKIYTAASARLLGEFRRTALALREFRSRVPKPEAAQKFKLRKHG